MKQEKDYSLNPYVTFNKLILFTVESYLTKAVEAGLSNDPLHKKMISGIRAYMVMGRFTPLEAAKVTAVGEHEFIQTLTKREISFVVYALELLRLWVQEVPAKYRKSIYLGVGSKTLLKGRATFTMSMLNLKKKDEAKYKELREIIDESVLVAKSFFMYMEGRLV